MSIRPGDWRIRVGMSFVEGEVTKYIEGVGYAVRFKSDGAEYLILEHTKGKKDEDSVHE